MNGESHAAEVEDAVARVARESGASIEVLREAFAKLSAATSKSTAEIEKALRALISGAERDFRRALKSEPVTYTNRAARRAAARAERKNS